MGDIREFATSYSNQQVCFKVTSSSINFEVKTIGNAGIALSKALKSSPEFYFTFGYDQLVLIQKSGENQDRKSVSARNIVNMEEFKRFWISWNGNGLKLGSAGCFKPLLMHNFQTNDIKFITFFRLKGSNSPVYWRVELPPVLKTPPLKPIQGGKLNWVPITAETNVLPDGCLIGGYEDEIIYIVRAKHRGSLTPGKFVPSEGIAYISWGGDAISKDLFEVLCGYDCAWVATSEDTIPLGAVEAGYSENIEHEKLYVGRAKHLGHNIPGKVQPSHKVCYIPYEGKEIAVKDYEILVVTEDDTLYMNTLESYESYEDVNFHSDPEEENDPRMMWAAPPSHRHLFNAFNCFT